MNFNSPESLLKHLKSNLDKSNYDSAEVIDSFSPNKTVYTIKVVTSTDRVEVFDSIEKMLRRAGNPRISSEQTYLPVFFVKTGVNPNGKEVTTKILVKPSNGLLMLKEPMYNQLLFNLSNFKSLRRSTDSVYEFNIIKKFNMELMDIGEGLPVHVAIQDKIYKDIIGMVSGPAFAKADFMLIDKYGQPQCFISHKAGSSAKDFQQYSGISNRAGNYIFNSAEVVKFRNDVVKMAEGNNINAAVYRDIRDVKVKERAVFGKDFNKATNAKSPDNIDFFAQGDIIISLIGKKMSNFGTTPLIKVNFSTKLINKRNISQMASGSYNPVLGARPGESYRKLESELTSVYGVRAGIFPEGAIKSRRNATKI